jgi:hypothetical protein
MIDEQQRPRTWPGLQALAANRCGAAPTLIVLCICSALLFTTADGASTSIVFNHHARSTAADAGSSSYVSESLEARVERAMNGLADSSPLPDIVSRMFSVRAELVEDKEEDLGLMLAAGIPLKFIRRHRQQQRLHGQAMAEWRNNKRDDASSSSDMPVNCGWAADWMGPNVTKEECPKCLVDGCLLWIDNLSFCADCRPRVEAFNFTYPVAFSILFVFALNYVIRHLRLCYIGKNVGIAFSPQFFAVVVIMWSSVALAVASSSMWGFDRKLSMKQYLNAYMLGYGTAMAPSVITCLNLVVSIYWNMKSRHGIRIKKPGFSIPLLIVVSLIVGYTLIAFLGISIHLMRVLTSNKNSTFSQTASLLAYVGHGLVWLSVPITTMPAVHRLTKAISKRRDVDTLKFYRLRIVIFGLIEFMATTIHLARFLYYQYSTKDHLLFFTFDLLEFTRILELVRMSNVLFLADSMYNDYPMEEIMSLITGRGVYRYPGALDFESAMNSESSKSRSSTISSRRGDGDSVTKMELDSVPPPSPPKQRRTDFSRKSVGTAGAHSYNSNDDVGGDGTHSPSSPKSGGSYLGRQGSSGGGIGSDGSRRSPGSRRKGGKDKYSEDNLPV